MTAFVDVYLPDRILGYGFEGLPRWSTSITAVASGSERRNRNWAHPLRTYTAPEGVRCWEDLDLLHDMWLALAGPLYSFPFRDPQDFASRKLPDVNTAPAVTSVDQVLGVGDGFNREFQLQKLYTYGPLSYTRPIFHPIVDTVLVALNALDPATPDPALEDGPYAWEVDRLTGIVTFDEPPAEDMVVTAGFLFDVEVRFESDDSYAAMVAAYKVAGHSDLSFMEVRPC